MEGKVKIIGTLNDKYKLIKFLGQGTTSRVYLAYNTQDNSQVAIKIFKPEFLNSGEAARQIFIDELSALLKLKHPNIVEMYDYGIDGSIIGDTVQMSGIWFIVLEYISERTMVDLIKQQGCMKEEVACFYFTQMVDVLTYIKSQGIAHRDIKLENMLVNNNYQLKFADFGFASFSQEKLTDQKGTPIYIAPEILENRLYDGEKVDVFSSGVCLFAMISGRYPITEWALPSDKLYSLIIQKKFEEYWNIFDQNGCYFSDTCKELIQGMLTYDDCERLNLDEIAEHEWFSIYSTKGQDEIKDDYKKVPKDNIVRRGLLNSGEKGGTDPFTGITDGFIVEQEELCAYYNDGTELQIMDGITLQDIVQELENLCQERKKKGKSCSLDFNYSEEVQSQELDQKRKSLRFKIKDNLEIEVKFINYLQEGELSPIFIKFSLIKGYKLVMYDWIEKIKQILDEKELIEC